MFNIKLNKTLLMAILLGVLILANLGYTLKESFDSNVTSSDATSALPPGIPKSQIADGDEDLYILKSEIVPPVCPKCPDSKTCPRSKPCSPCPPCARCPEPAFECKKIPTYSSTNSSLPRPFLNDFSEFA